MKILNKIDDKLKKRFFSKVKILDTGCHTWLAAINGPKYGTFSIFNKPMPAHRLAWIIANNKEIPEKMCICHHCDNRLCVNPEHLFLGTKKDNAKDRKNKGRNGNIKGEKNGRAKLTEKDVWDILNEYYKSPYKVFKYDIAKKYNVQGPAICKITTGMTWKYIFKEFIKEKIPLAVVKG